MELLETLAEGRVEIVEDASGVTAIKFPVLTVGKKTDAGHVYPADIVRGAVERYRAKIGSNSAFGFSGVKEKEPRLSEVSHSVTALDLRGDELLASANVLPTDAGKDLLAVLKGGGRLRTVLRGRGEVDASGNVTKYDLESLDFSAAQPTGPAVGLENIEEVKKREFTEDEIIARYRIAVSAGAKMDLAEYRAFLRRT